MTMKAEWIDYTHGDAALRGYLAHDAAVAEKRPAVMVIHRNDGMSDTTIRFTEQIARLGYVAFAADMFGVAQQPRGGAQRKEQSTIYNKDRSLMRARAQAGFDRMLASPLVDGTKVAVLGYCFGGTVAIEFAQSGAPIRGTITIHGSLRGFTEGASTGIKSPVLILHGAEDKTSPMPEVNWLLRDLSVSGCSWKMELYSGTGHGFSVPQNPSEEHADREAQAATARFLSQIFDPKARA